MRAARGAGLEWLGEEYPPDDEEEEDEDERDEDAGDRDVASADASRTPLYVTMPTIAGLKRTLALWRSFSTGGDRPAGVEGTAWWSLFGYLKDVREWSARDRVEPSTVAYLARRLARDPDAPVRIELDLWFRSDPDLRGRAREYVNGLMEAVGGRTLDFVTIEEILYQAALIEVPAAQARALGGLDGPLADANRVMRVRPQSLYSANPREPSGETPDGSGVPTAPDARPPIVAILDGYPVANHELLRNRVIVEEVDVAGVDVPVSRRVHGTAMTSLILHGDLASGEAAATRTVLAVPILAAPQSLATECTPQDRLPIGLVHRAVTAIVADGSGRDREDVRIVVVNHSVCDREAPFARRPSPWAKLLDHLAHRHRLLFVVSAGNVADAFRLDAYGSCQEFDDAPSAQRQVVLMRSIEAAKGGRLLLSPAESMNAITVGAVHADGSTGCPTGHVDPYADVGVTNLASGIGLGLNRAIKPDMVEHGGRQLVRTDTVDAVVSAWGYEHPDVGQQTAMPDRSGSLSRTGRSTGTSNAAALVTRASMRLADVVERLYAGSGEDWLASPTRAVALKALLAHGCRWGDTGRLLDSTYPGKWQRRREAIARFLGYGRSDVGRVLDADGSRITLLADDVIVGEQLHDYRLPIPRAMIGNRELRRITMTLAWSSPIDPASQRYRGVLVELVDAEGKRGFWDGVKATLQPTAYAGRRGTLQHLVLEGKKLMTATRDGHIFVGVQARCDVAAFAAEEVPYALAVTLELAQSVRQDLHADVAGRIRQKAARPTARPRTRIRT